MARRDRQTVPRGPCGPDAEGGLRRFVPCAVIVLATCAAYAGSLRGVFIFDDLGSIVVADQLHDFRPLRDVVWGPPQSTAAGRPLVCLSLAVNYAVSGLNTWSYHVFNGAVHLAAALTLFGLIRRTLVLPTALGIDHRRASWLACSIATLWAVHPLQTDAVTYIIQRTESLMGLFYLLTLYCALRAWQSARPAAWSAAAVAACALGALSKEVMVSVPLAGLLYDRAFVAGSFRDAIRRHGRLHAALAAVAWVIVGAIVAAQPHGEAIGFAGGISGFQYLLTQAGVIVHYLRLSFVPHPLVISYDDWPVARSVGEIWIQGVLVAVMLGATGCALVRRPALGLLGAAFFMILAPTSSFVPMVNEVAAERRMYLPLAVVLILAMLGLQQAAAWAGRRAGWPESMPRGFVAFVVTLLSGGAVAGTVARNRLYRDDLTLWADTVDKRPLNARAHHGLGDSLARRGDLDGAIRHLTEAVRLRPGFPEAHTNLANALAGQGRFDEAIRHYQLALEAKPDAWITLNNLANALAASGRTAEAVRFYEKALDLNDNLAEAHNNLGSTLLDQGRADEALGHLQKAVEIKPDFPEARANLGLLLHRLNRIDEAVEHYREALRLRPDMELVRQQLAGAEALVRPPGP